MRQSLRASGLILALAAAVRPAVAAAGPGISTAAEASAPSMFTYVEQTPCAPLRRNVVHTRRPRPHPRRRPPVAIAKPPPRRRPPPRTLAELAHRPARPTRCEVERQSPLYTTTALETPADAPVVVSDATPPTGRFTTPPTDVSAGEPSYGPSLVPDFPAFPAVGGGPSDEAAGPPAGAPTRGAGGGPPGAGSPGGGTGVSPAPEPAQWLLLAFGVALCGHRLRRRARPAETAAG